MNRCPVTPVTTPSAGKGAPRAEADQDRVPEAFCREQIDKIAESVTFARAGQLRDLLRWLGNRSLDGAAGPPSEREIACHVLGRPDFDPRTDALVRKEMGRLREKLSRYYLSEGIRDQIALTANNGYTIHFERKGAGPAENGPECWLVLPLRTRDDLEEMGTEVLEETLMGLQERGGPELVSPATAMSYRYRPGDPRQFAAECRARCVVEGSLRRRNEGLEAILWLVDGQSGRARRSRRFHGADAAGLAAETVAWLLESGEENSREEDSGKEDSGKDDQELSAHA